MTSAVFGKAGSAAVEFAIIAPVFVAALLGTFEVTRLVRTQMQLAVTGQVVADLIARTPTIPPAPAAPGTAALADICQAASLSIAPFSSAGLAAAAARVTNNSGTIALDWQNTGCGGAVAIADPVGLGTPVIPNYGDSVVIVQVTYAYQAPISFVLPATFALSSVAYARPRDNLINTPGG